jgi:UDP-N-acetylglucosamine/UDP-N-acetylgalactosamine 4-epimerase
MVSRPTPRTMAHQRIPEGASPAYERCRETLRAAPRRWVVTGAAGFIGSNLVEVLLALGQEVVGVDNFATGHPHNLDEVRARVGPAAAERFRFVEGDIRDLAMCHEVFRECDIVLHQAALGSVPRSLDDPLATHSVNLTGFLNVLVAARDAGARLVYAASSSTYGDHPALPKVEEVIGRPLSPYAVTKFANELYAAVFQRSYGIQAIGLRYFNVFGRRQDPDGAYAAVIPRWTGALLRGDRCWINGDGETTRDFCYVENVVQANLLAATAPPDATGEVYNVAVGERTSLLDLFALLRTGLAERRPDVAAAEPEFRAFRPGDVRHSLASIQKASDRLGYRPTHTLGEGLAESLDWYVETLRPDTVQRASCAPDSSGGTGSPRASS